ncbi:kinase-like domain-containing protein [Chaetomium sp. MPI-SDFR-AT-0129]|nr:kinase-like domain-containing protein [Chaetomium sp. MPI-SDFR-AT-0129]
MDPYSDDEKLAMLPFLELRFSKLPRAPGGLVFGTDGVKSDVQLPQVGRASGRQFSITFKNDFPDGRYRLVVHDLGSTFGTEVSYDGNIDKSKEKKKFRRIFDWLVSGNEYPQRDKAIIQIQINEFLTFRIVPVHRDVTSPTYTRNVERFLRGAPASDTFLNALRLQSGPQTVATSTAQTPFTGPILLPMDSKSSNGTFGLVTRVWNASTGEEYACKRPVSSKFNVADWKREVETLERFQHAHIVRVCMLFMSPRPEIYLEFMRGGSLHDQHTANPFTFEECCEILRQCLTALVHLHGQTPPVAHRDLKPANILVQSRRPLYVKLGDFGAAKGGPLATRLGTYAYAAPEMQADAVRGPYTERVDVYALGATVLDLGYGRPGNKYGTGLSWCKEVDKRSRSIPKDGLLLILWDMMIFDAKNRLSAKDSLARANILCDWVKRQPDSVRRARPAARRRE